MSDQARKTDKARTRVSILVSAILLWAFGVIAHETARGDTSAFDRQVLLAFRDPSNPSVPIGPAWLQEAARDVTSLGSIVVLTIITLAAAAYLLLANRRGAALLMLFAVFGGMVLVELLKAIIARPRPDLLFHAVRVFTASFPSGHASLSAITYLTAGAILARSQPSFALRFYFATLASFITVLIGVSRLYLGVHYPTDVLAGWCIGSAWAIACWVIAEWLEAGREVQPPTGFGRGQSAPVQ